MSQKKKTPASRQTVTLQSKPYFARLFDRLATVYLAVTVLVLPLFMSREKYTAITAAKSRFFSLTTAVALAAVIILLAAMCIYAMDEEKKSPGLTIRQRIKSDPMLVTDGAIVAYWLLMLISCLQCDDVHTALYGIEPRNNGFFYQTLYVAAYFIISRGMKPARWKALLFVWGGVVLSVPTILHYYGVDVYDVVHYSAMNSAGEWKDYALESSYAGPFWNSTTFRFLGPVGNVNLGSYILSVALVLAAGFFITGVAPVFPWLKKSGETSTGLAFTGVTDRHGISLLVSFVIILFAELNINTDAGLVAIAAAVVAIPVALCATLERLSRCLAVLSAAAGTVWLDRVIDCFLKGKSPGKLGIILLAGAIVLAIAAVLVHQARSREKLRAVATVKNMRTVMCVLMALAVVGGVALSLYVTKPDEPAAGAVSGAVEVLQSADLKEKSDTIIHELGQILRGNLDDSFGHNRLFTWKRTLSLIKYNPFFGIGPDNFKTFFARYYRAEAVEMFPSSNGNIDKAHNEFLDVLLSNGIIGFVAYMGFFAALLWCCFRRTDKTRFAPAFGVAVVSYMAHAFFGYQLPIQSPVMWIMIGAAAAFARWYPEEEESLVGA